MLMSRFNIIFFIMNKEIGVVIVCKFKSKLF